jgi:hypothetical protein
VLGQQMFRQTIHRKKMPVSPDVSVEQMMRSVPNKMKVVFSGMT